jgi:DNA polymerase III subunit epsilon
MSWWHMLRGRAPVDAGRWIVLDVESSGLDAARDRLLAIAAVALRMDGAAPRIDLADSFEVVLRQPEVVVDKPNILLHGIGVGAQREGMDPHGALEALERWVGTAPLIAFHAAFDETLIRRAMKTVLARGLPNPWLDLEHVAEVLRPDLKARSLDEWMAALGVQCAVRHQAAADTFATAELLLKLWPAIRAQGATDFGTLARLAEQRRWLRR